MKSGTYVLFSTLVILTTLLFNVSDTQCWSFFPF